MRLWSPPVPSLLVSITLASAAWSAAPTPPVFTDAVTVTATGEEEPADDVPVAVTVITREEIDDAQEGTVADLLRRAPGLTLLRAGDRGSASSLFTRGTESDHTLALFDGVRLTSPYFGGYDWSLLPTAGLGRVEVARGPFSALWGPDAIGGVVNVVPARARDGLAATLFGETGQDRWRRLEGSLGWAGGGLDLWASGFVREGEGALENSDFSTDQILLDLGWTWDEGRRIALVVQDLGTDAGIPFVDPQTLSPHRRQTADQRVLAMPLRLRVSARWNVELTLSRVERELGFRDPDDAWGFTSADTSADTDQARLSSRHDLGDHALTWGGEWRRDEVTDVSALGVSLDDRSSTVSSVFLQDDWRLADHARIIAGVRWDDADGWGSEVSPRVAVSVRPHEAVELRAGFGEAFRQPSVGELYFPFSGNPELAAETSRSAEAGVTWSGDASRLRLDVFATEVDNLIDFDYGTYAFANAGHAEILGAEAAWELVLSDHLLSALQITWLDTEDGAGDSLLRRPDWSASWTLGGAVGSRIRGDLTVVWVGARADVDPISFERIRLPGHLTATLALACRLVAGLELTLRAQNLADRSYQEVAGYPAPGRRVVGGLRWTLSSP